MSYEQNISKQYSCAWCNSSNITTEITKINIKKPPLLRTESYPNLFAGYEYLQSKKAEYLDDFLHEDPKQIKLIHPSTNDFIKPCPIKPYFPDENYSTPKDKKIIFCNDCKKKSIIIPAFCKKCFKHDIIIRQYPENFNENDLINYIDDYICILCKPCVSIGCNHIWETYKSAFFPDTISNTVCQICKITKRD
jgi:hypothetical protein